LATPLIAFFVRPYSILWSFRPASTCICPRSRRRTPPS